MNVDVHIDTSCQFALYLSTLVSVSVNLWTVYLTAEYFIFGKAFGFNNMTLGKLMNFEILFSFRTN